jgi:inosine-uridine nucleoside N-ribohydrolase
MAPTSNILQAATTTRIIIDTDPGIDDAAAILMALGSPEIQVEALTTVFGNAPVTSSTRNALRILEAAHRTDVPVYEGVGKPYNGNAPMFAAHVHGSDGFGDGTWPLPTTSCQPQNAVIELIERVLQAPGEIALVALGRLTNIALALSVEPRLAKALQTIVVMGGAIRVPGNASPVASANLWGDPEAADVVYRSGARIVQIGLDVCNQVEISLEQQLSVWQAQSPATRLLETLTPCLKRSYNQRGLLRHSGGVRYNDMPAIAYVIDASLFTCRDVYILIETQGHYTRGQTVADMEGQSGEKPNVTAAFEVDVSRLTALWIERVTRLNPTAPSV